MVTLRPYQQRILTELNSLPAVGLFMGTGTGKTITSLFRVKSFDTDKLLVICPAKVVAQWKDVIPTVLPDYRLFEPRKAMTSSEFNEALKAHADEIKQAHTAIVVSLESLAKLTYLQRIINAEWTMIVDESHKIKEYGTARSPVKVTHAALALSVLTPYKMILTATPTQKDKGGYIDYYTQLKFLGYLDLPYKNFRERYCIMQKIQPIGMPFPIEVIKGYKNTAELDRLLKLCCRRYVAKFGDFDPQHIKISLPAPKAYAKLSKEHAYKDLDLTNISARRMAKKTLTSGTIAGHDLFGEALKYEDNTIKADWVSEFLSNTDETVVIFYKYNVELAILEAVCKRLNKSYIVLNGANKQKYEDIKTKTYDVVLGQFAAAGESVDGLQYRSHICLYYAMPESSLEHRQALGRIDRDGQTKVPMYYYLIAEKTIDEAIFDMTQRKIEFSEETLNKLQVV